MMLLKSKNYNPKTTEIAFFGGSFTAIEKGYMLSLLDAGYEEVNSGRVSGIRVSTRPDAINETIIKRALSYHMTAIELGVQSTNDYILKKCKRGHTFEDVKRASKLIRRFGFTLGHQMMVGLSESTRLDVLNTAKDLAKLKPKMIRIYPVLVIRNTELEEEYKKGEYEPVSLTGAVEVCKELYYFFEKKKIKVIRIGLQNTDLI